jgi:hypothetical protein
MQLEPESHRTQKYRAQARFSGHAYELLQRTEVGAPLRDARKPEQTKIKQQKN